MKWTVLFSISLACVAIALPTDNTLRPKRDLQLIKKLISSIFPVKTEKKSPVLLIKNTEDNDDNSFIGPMASKVPGDILETIQNQKENEEKETDPILHLFTTDLDTTNSNATRRLQNLMNLVHLEILRTKIAFIKELISAAEPKQFIIPITANYDLPRVMADNSIRFVDTPGILYTGTPVEIIDVINSKSEALNLPTSAIAEVHEISDKSVVIDIPEAVEVVESESKLPTAEIVSIPVLPEAYEINNKQVEINVPKAVVVVEPSTKEDQIIKVEIPPTPTKYSYKQLYKNGSLTFLADTLTGVTVTDTVKLPSHIPVAHLSVYPSMFHTVKPPTVNKPVIVDVPARYVTQPKKIDITLPQSIYSYKQIKNDGSVITNTGSPNGNIVILAKASKKPLHSTLNKIQQVPGIPVAVRPIKAPSIVSNIALPNAVSIDAPFEHVFIPCVQCSSENNNEIVDHKSNQFVQSYTPVEIGTYPYKQAHSDGISNTYLNGKGTKKSDIEHKSDNTEDISTPQLPFNIANAIEDSSVSANTAVLPRIPQVYSFKINNTESSVDSFDKGEEYRISNKNINEGDVIFEEPVKSRYVYKQINHSRPNQQFTVVKIEDPLFSNTKVLESNGLSINDHSYGNDYFSSYSTPTSTHNSEEYVKQINRIPQDYVYLPPSYASENVPPLNSQIENESEFSNSNKHYLRVLPLQETETETMTSVPMSDYSYKQGSTDGVYANNGTSVNYESKVVSETVDNGKALHSSKFSSNDTSLNDNPIIVEDSISSTVDDSLNDTENGSFVVGRYSYKQTHADGSSTDITGESKSDLITEMNENESNNSNNRQRGDIPTL